MSLPVPPQFPKRCNTCGTKHTAEQWARLELKGEQVSDWDSMEMRNCSCESTLAVVRAIFLFEAA